MKKITQIFFSIITYFKESKNELKKVVWLSRQDLYKHTLIVICVSLATAAFLGVFDFIFAKILELVI